MNYRHDFHAGNFADVMKHALLARVLVHLLAKPTAFRVIDTHAGAGVYDLAGEEARRTGEWHGGIGRLAQAPLAAPAEALLEPWREATAIRPGAMPALYPGSPLIARHFTRPQDRLSLNELHPPSFSALAAAIGRERRAAVNCLDGWLALKAQIPPPERRGLILIDPPFEQPGEFGRLSDALHLMHRKWPTGIALVWYPIKADGAAAAFIADLRGRGIAKLARFELMVAPVRPDAPLSATGLIVMNPPWLLMDEARILLPALAERMATEEGRAAFVAEWLTDEAGAPAR